MHELRSAQYRINRASLQAQRATDAGIFIDDRDRGGALFAEPWTGRQSGSVEQIAQRLDRRLAAGRAQIKFGATGQQRYSIGPATGKTALGALCLRQYAFDALDGGILTTVEARRRRPKRRRSQQRETTHEQDGGDHARFGWSGAKQAGEADKCHRHQPGRDQGNRRAFEWRGHVGGCESLP